MAVPEAAAGPPQPRTLLGDMTVRNDCRVEWLPSLPGDRHLGELRLDLSFEPGDAVYLSAQPTPLLFVGVDPNDLELEHQVFEALELDFEVLGLPLLNVSTDGQALVTHVSLRSIVEVLRCREGYHRSQWSVLVDRYPGIDVRRDLKMGHVITDVRNH